MWFSFLACWNTGTIDIFIDMDSFLKSKAKAMTFLLLSVALMLTKRI